MESHKLFQIYKQYICSIISLLVALYDTRYNQPNYFWYYRPSIIDPITLKRIIDYNKQIFISYTNLFSPYNTLCTLNPVLVNISSMSRDVRYIQYELLYCYNLDTIINQITLKLNKALQF